MMSAFFKLFLTFQLLKTAQNCECMLSWTCSLFYLVPDANSKLSLRSLNIVALCTNSPQAGLLITVMVHKGLLQLEKHLMLFISFAVNCLNLSLVILLSVSELYSKLWTWQIESILANCLKIHGIKWYIPKKTYPAFSHVLPLSKLQRASQHCGFYCGVSKTSSINLIQHPYVFKQHVLVAGSLYRMYTVLKGGSGAAFVTSHHIISHGILEFCQMWINVWEAWLRAAKVLTCHSTRAVSLNRILFFTPALTFGNVTEKTCACIFTVTDMRQEQDKVMSYLI